MAAADHPNALPGPTKLWTPARLGASARFIARPPKVGTTDRVTLTGGADIVALANDGGTAGPMSSVPGAYCHLDGSDLQNGYQAIRTYAPTCGLGVATGGPSGSGSFHLFALAQIVAQPSSAAGREDSTFLLSGPPGSDAAHRNSGIGCVSDGNGPWLRDGGQQNPLAQGGNLPRAVLDTRLHLYEMQSNSAAPELVMLRDGGRLGLFPGATTLSSGRMGFSGDYPAPSHGPPDTRIFWAGWFDRLLSEAERSLLCKYIKSEYAFRPRRFFQSIGDSITQGHIAGASTTSYLEQLASQYASAGEVIESYNTGISSQTTAQILARVDATYLLSFAPAGFRTQWLIIGGRTNDSGVGLSPAQSYENLASIVAIARGAGVETAVITCLPRVSMTSGDVALHDEFNGYVLENSAGADKVIDLRPLMPVPATLAYLPDGVHPSDAVHAAMAAVIKATIG